MSSIASPIAPTTITDWNPFASPIKVEVQVPQPVDSNLDAVQIRKEHLSKERALLGVARLFGGAAVINVCLAFLYGYCCLVAVQQEVYFEMVREMGLISVLSALIAVLYLSIGRGLRKFERSAFPYGLGSAVIAAVLNFPIGAILWGYVFVILCLPKTHFLFGEQHEQARAATPHIVCPKPWGAIILTTACVTLVVIAAIAGTIVVTVAPERVVEFYFQFAS